MNAVLLSVKGVTKSYGGLKAVDNLDFCLRGGEIVSVVGPNGAGKTTFFDCLTGMTAIDSGSITLLGKDVTGSKAHNIANMGIARTFQLTRIFGQVTVLENVVLAQYRFVAGGPWKIVSSLVRDAWKKENTERAIELLELVKLGERRGVSAGSLPIGERKRLELAIALATRPKILLLDEPTAGMNPAETDEVLDLLNHLKAGGMGICLVEHDMRMVMTVSDRVVILNFGRKIAEGTPAEVSRDPKVIEAYLGGSVKTETVAKE